MLTTSCTWENSELRCKATSLVKLGRVLLGKREFLLLYIRYVTNKFDSQAFHIVSVGVLKKDLEMHGSF